MYSVLYHFAGLIILINFIINYDIRLKWKISLTVLLIGVRLFVPGIFALLSSGLVLVVMLLMLNWNGVKL